MTGFMNRLDFIACHFAPCTLAILEIWGDHTLDKLNIIAPVPHALVVGFYRMI